MSKKENIQLLLNPTMFWDERPAMTAFNENEVQEAINASFNLINGECSNLPYKVLEFNAPHIENSETQVDNQHELYRNDYELDQFRQAIITQTQYTLNLGNDYSQGSSTFSSGGMSATIQRPENRDIFAPGVKLFLKNARLYELQVYQPNNNFQKSSCSTQINKFLTYDVGDTRYVKMYQENATQGQVAFIDESKQVSFANPSEIEFKNYKADLIKDRDGEYREIKDVQNLAWFGESGTDAATKTEITNQIDANKIYKSDWTYRQGDVVYTWNETLRYLDCWKSNQDNNIGHDPNLDNSNFFWWEKLWNKEIRAKYILDPTDNVYKTINQFGVEYFGGMTREQIYTAINASGTVWDETLTYRKGFVVIHVDSNNNLNWYKSLQNNNQGHNPETSPEWWEDLPNPAIDVNQIVEQIKPMINSIVDSEMDKKLQALQTAITTDFSGSVYAFADEQAFQQFLRDNPKLNADMFDDVQDSVDLSNYAVKNATNSFSAKQNFDAGADFRNTTQILSDKEFKMGWTDSDIKLRMYCDQGAKHMNIHAPQGDLKITASANVFINTRDTLNLGNKRINNLANPTGEQDAATKSYVDTKLSISDAQSGYARMGSGISNDFQSDNIFRKSPQNMGQITDPKHLATKEYVDKKASGGGGDTFTIKLSDLVPEDPEQEGTGFKKITMEIVSSNYQLEYKFTPEQVEQYGLENAACSNITIKTFGNFMGERIEAQYSSSGTMFMNSKDNAFIICLYEKSNPGSVSMQSMKDAIYFQIGLLQEKEFKFILTFGGTDMDKDFWFNNINIRNEIYLTFTRLPE